MAGLGQAQLQAVVQQVLGGFQMGQNTGNLQGQLQAALSSAGASPDQIQALQNDQLPSSPAGIGAWNSGAPPVQTWVQQVMNAENAAPGGANAPNTQGSGTGMGGSTGTGNGTPGAPQFNPATIASQFPNGLPQETASGIGGVPSINAQSVNPTTIDPNMSIAATEAYLQPQFAQQQSALTANLANAGIVGGTAPQAAAQLGQQQQTTLQNNIQPFLQAGALANQSTNLAGQEANQGANLTAQQANQNATMQGSEFNASAANQAQQFNIQNLLQTGQIDAATYNAMMSQIMGYQNQDWQAQLGAQANQTANNQNGTNNAFNPVYQQPSGTNLSGVGAAAGSAFQVPQQTQAPATKSLNNEFS